MIRINSPEFLVPDWPVPDCVGSLVTCRSGGVSSGPYHSMNLALHVGDEREDVLQNRRLLAKQINRQLQWQWLKQVHSNKVQRIDAAQEPLVGDALITTASGIACCVLTADCLPVFFAANDGSEVAIAHAGWRGLASGIVANTLLGMSVPADQVLVWLGPAIGPCHFEVGLDVKESFLSQWLDLVPARALAECFQPVHGSQKFMADLFALVRLQLNALGVGKLFGGGECTFCQSDKFYSFRRANQTGRLLSMIYLKQAS